MRLSVLKMLLMAGFAFIVNGCTPAVNSQQLQAGASNKDMFEKTLQDMEKDTSSQGEMWYWLNLARLYQNKHDYQKSIAAFEKAEAILDEYEARAEVNMRGVGAGLGSLLFSKGSETYYGKGYERTLMHTLNSLNYAMLGNFESATVEMRKMEKRQEFWLKESEEKIAEAQEKSSDLKGSNANSIPAGYSMAEMLEDGEVRAMANNYQDAFSYALSSVLSKIANDPEYSEISKKRALALSPEVDRFFNVPNAPKKDASQVEVNVVVLSGQAPAYTIDKIRFPLLSLKSYVVLDLPSLKKPVGDVASVHVEDSLYGIDASRLLKTDKMAYKTLKDELPLEITKSVVRATTKGVVSKQMGDRGGALAGLGAALLMDVTSSVMEKSYRNWELLPNSGYLIKLPAKRGDNVSISLGGRAATVIIPENTKNGSLILVSYLSYNNMEVDHVEY